MSDPGVPPSGTLVPVADPARPDFAELRRRIRQEGLSRPLFAKLSR